jgi:hypothetical protein
MTAPRFQSWGFCSGDLRINYAWCIGWTKVQNPKVKIVESLTLLVGGLVMIIIFRDQGQWPHQYVYAFYQTYTCFHLVEPRCKPWKEEPICKFRNGVGGLSLSLTFFFSVDLFLYNSYLPYVEQPAGSILYDAVCNLLLEDRSPIYCVLIRAGVNFFYLFKMNFFYIFR